MHYIIVLLDADKFFSIVQLLQLMVGRFLAAV